VNKDIHKYNFKEGLPQEFEILDFEYLFTNFSEEIIQPHRAEFYQILWFETGTATHLVDFKPIKTKPNTFLFINKNSVQIFDKNLSYKGKLILFTDTFFCKTETDTKFLSNNILFNDLLSISQINVSDNISMFTDVFKQLEIELKNPKDHCQSDILPNLLKNQLLHSERKRRKQDFIELKKDANLDYALQLKDLLESHFITQKKVSFYCEQLHLTSKRLNQVTSKIFGKTPKELINHRVLLESKRLLAHTHDSVKEIGFSLGFEEPTNFIKYFKKNTHKTPIEFRAQFITA
jgi:AraC family transcriptional regulator, transcriptional activator of pobA